RAGHAAARPGRAPAGAAQRQVPDARAPVGGQRRQAGPFALGAVGGARGVDGRGVWRGAGAARRRAEEKIVTLLQAPAELWHSTPLATTSHRRTAHIRASHGQMPGRPASTYLH
uniref:Uncharacterized protein n=1 Tax=Triticum urartu TaxID=4572 RepID=A0A8R7QJF7_TRIUA